MTLIYLQVKKKNKGIKIRIFLQTDQLYAI